MTSETAIDPKSADERRIERLTWFGLVGALVVASALPSWLTLHNGITPLAAGSILILSGFLRNRRGFRVGYLTWITGALLLATAAFNSYSRPDLDLSLITVVVTILIVGAGTFTRAS